jgi:hypothetical protein
VKLPEFLGLGRGSPGVTASAGASIINRNAPSGVAGLALVATLAALAIPSFGSLPMRLMAVIASHGAYPVPLLLAP